MLAVMAKPEEEQELQEILESSPPDPDYPGCVEAWQVECTYCSDRGDRWVKGGRFGFSEGVFYPFCTPCLEGSKDA